MGVLVLEWCRYCLCCRLCLSISDFHPDTWNPAWSVSTILTGLLSFMVTCCFFSLIPHAHIAHVAVSLLFIVLRHCFWNLMKDLKICLHSYHVHSLQYVCTYYYKNKYLSPNNSRKYNMKLLDNTVVKHTWLSWIKLLLPLRHLYTLSLYYHNVCYSLDWYG